MLEKNNATAEVAQITFNWERVKKRASSKREQLVNNSPNVVKRTPAAKPVNTSASTRTTDTLTDPYTNIDIQHKQMTSNPIPSPPSQSTIPYTDNETNPYIDMETDDTHTSGTHTSSDTHTPDGTHTSNLLAPAAAQGELTLASQESPGPESNAVALLQAIKAKEVSGSELTVDERRLVVRSMKELGQTQDAIAELLKVSRRTIVNDYKVLRQEQALAIQNTDTNEIAGEVYEVARTCIRRALQAGSFKTVSTIMRDMVEVLQSLGILYRAPKTSMQATMHGDMPGRRTGYHKYMDGIAGDKNKVVEVLDCMFDAIGNGQIQD